MKTVNTKRARELLAERGIKVSYPTLAQWVREGRFAGAGLEETDRGPVWRIPVDSIRAFEAPKIGRPKSETTERLNAAFRQATEADGKSGKKASKRRGRKAA
jgi:hypothetical protein